MWDVSIYFQVLYLLPHLFFFAIFKKVFFSFPIEDPEWLRGDYCLKQKFFFFQKPYKLIFASLKKGILIQWNKYMTRNHWRILTTMYSLFTRPGKSFFFLLFLWLLKFIVCYSLSNIIEYFRQICQYYKYLLSSVLNIISLFDED